jgi:hypothetical protein
MAASPSLFAKAPILTSRDLAHPPPNVIRTCCAFGVELSIAHIPFARRNDITGLDEIGNHVFLGDSDEGNGILYAQQGGFIDVGHLRDYADWTAYLYTTIQACKHDGIDTLTLNLGFEGGAKSLVIALSSIGEDVDEYELAGSMAYSLSLWHEIATWYGASYVPFIPERYSSFSPEDIYSNLLGVRLGIEALKSDLEFNEAMTQLLNKKLIELGATVTAAQTTLAFEAVEDIWWTREAALPGNQVLLKRYLDRGDYLSPWLLPQSEHQVGYQLKKPEAAMNAYYKLQVRVNNKIPSQVNAIRARGETITQLDFDELMSCIEDELALECSEGGHRHQKSIARKEKRIEARIKS